MERRKKADFTINLDSQTISDIKASIDQARQNIDAVNQNTIDNVCIQITDLFSKSATKSFNHSESFVETMEFPNHKRWFGSQCKSARRKYHLARICNYIIPSSTNKQNLKQASKNKRIMNFQLNKHTKNMQNKLWKLKSKNPKEFWKIINSLENKHEEQNISIETLYDFFKGLNENNEHDNDDHDINIDWKMLEIVKKQQVLGKWQYN